MTTSLPIVLWRRERPVDRGCETCYALVMKTITIRDLRQRWPEAEAALKIENEILITRDGEPVAKLMRLAVAVQKRRRWDMEQHARWQDAGSMIGRPPLGLAYRIVVVLIMLVGLQLLLAANAPVVVL